MKNNNKISKDNPFINNDDPVPRGTQEITGDSNKVPDYSLPEQGKLTQKEINIINKYIKEKGIDFTDLVLFLNKMEKEHNIKSKKK